MSCKILAGLTGVTVLLLTSTSVQAQFINVEIVDVTKDVGTPEGFVTYRVVANFGGMDLVLAWGGIAGAAPLDFFTGNGVELLNAGGKYAGLKAEDFPAFPIAEAYDSWVSLASTIDNDGDGSYDEGFLGSDGVHAVIVGSSFHDDDGLVSTGNPKRPRLGPEVVMAQFTIPGVPGGGPGDPGHNGFHLEGSVIWAGAGAGFEISPFIVDNIIPAPGGLVLLGLFGLAGPRRRRGSAAGSG